MAKPRFVTPNILLENPKRITSVKADHPELVNNKKAQLKHLRRFYRLMRDDQGLLEQDIIPMMIDHFPGTMSKLIELAGFIETKVTYIPFNQISRWVTVPFEAIYSLTHHALKETGNHSSAMRLIAAYLWYKFSKGEEITPPRDIYGIAGLSKKKFKDDLSDNFGIKINHKFTGLRNPPRVRTSWIITWNDTLPIEGITYEDVSKYKSRIHIGDPPQIPTQLEKDYLLHQIYHPQSPFQWLDKECPIILSDGEYATIPLVKGIVPILISSITSKHALSEWFKAGKVKQPSKKITTLYGKARTAINNLSGTVNYISPGQLQFILAPKTYLHEFWQAQDSIMQRGLLIDEKVLRSIEPPNIESKSKGWNHRHIKKLNEIKQSILTAIGPKNGIYRGVYGLGSNSERIYYKNNPVQNFPGCFKAAVIAPDEYQLVYIDITACDLSILFNLAQDQNGLKLLRTGQDPYAHLASEASSNTPNPITRKMVKEVINPWIYGAGIPTIVNNGELIDEAGAEKVIKALEKEFAGVAQWIEQIDKTVNSAEMIPAGLNPIDNTDIPIPKLFSRRVAPSLLIQRASASILKQAVVWLNNHAFSSADVVLTVHDSILMVAPADEGALPEADATQAIEYGMQRTRGMTVLNVQTGKGPDWETAEGAATRTSCRSE